MAERFYVETLGCPKNAVDSDKVVATLLADGLLPTDSPGDADLVVVNTCAFIDAARQESIDVALGLADAKRPDARLVVTGCMAERYGDELAAALPEADAVVGFADEGALVDVVLRGRKPSGVRDLLELPAPGAARAVGLREGGRGLRPRLRLLCDPVVPRRAAIAVAGVDRGGGARRSCGPARPRSSSSRRTSRGTDATSASRARSHRCCAAWTRWRARASSACGCCTCTRARSRTRSSRRCSSCRPSCRTSTCRSSTRRPGCCGA